MTKVTLYPGCALEGTAADYAASIAGVTPLLDLELVELKDWNCCGATAARSIKRAMGLALPARNLALAAQAGRDVVAPCAQCFSRLKFAEKALLGADAAWLGIPYQGNIRVWDLLDYLTQPHLQELVAQKVVKPLAGLRAVAYYGCLRSRPPRVTDAGDHENPQAMERLLTVLGAEALDWPYKTDCCGGGLTLSRPDIIDTLVQLLYERALAHGAECLVASCQMCQANTDLPQERISKKFGKKYDLPVFYFTELIGLALGHPDVDKWLAGHLVDPRPLLRRKGLLA